MLQLPEELRNQIVSYLPSISVPAQVGANIMQIVTALNNLVQASESSPEISKETPHAD